MSAWDPAAYMKAMLEDMRAHGGAVTQGPLAGDPIMVMTSTGAKTGEPRQALLTFSRDGEDYVVAGTAGGSPTTPAWVHNVSVHPQVMIEAEGRTFQATAKVTEEPDRLQLWKEHVKVNPRFAEYPKKTTRPFPMVRLTPTSRD
jgi:F420H(2)-dependent quinone reductase